MVLKKLSVPLLLCLINSMLQGEAVGSPHQLAPEDQWGIFTPSLAGIITSTVDDAENQLVGNGCVIESSLARGTYVLSVDHLIGADPSRIQVVLFSEDGVKPSLFDAMPVFRHAAVSPEFSKLNDKLKSLFDDQFYPDGGESVGLGAGFRKTYAQFEEAIDEVKNSRDIENGGFKSEVQESG